MACENNGEQPLRLAETHQITTNQLTNFRTLNAKQLPHPYTFMELCANHSLLSTLGILLSHETSMKVKAGVAEIAQC